MMIKKILNKQIPTLAFSFADFSKVNKEEYLKQRIAQEQMKVKKRFLTEIKAQESHPEDKEYTVDGLDKGSKFGEYGNRPRGPEPTRYGDWERKGRCIDF